MTRKDYKQIASAFAQVRDLISSGTLSNPRITLNCIENEICAVMQSDNPRCDDGIFRAARHRAKAAPSSARAQTSIRQRHALEVVDSLYEPSTK